MDTATQVLLIIVSAALSVFLILAGVATILLIRTLKKINEMADRVENTADVIGNTATSVPLFKLASKIFNWNRKRKR